MNQPNNNTSWNVVANWYNQIVGSQGHYYHQHVVIPNLLQLLNLQPDDSLLDLGCGQGIIAHVIPQITRYLGLDLAPQLISAAKKNIHKPNFEFRTQDVTKPIKNVAYTFSHACIILALQNMQNQQAALQNAAAHLKPNGKLVLVLNHPCFRIPRQSGWGIDEKTKQQYRWINRYLNPLKIPISMHPGKNPSAMTWSFHHSLQDYSNMLTQAGFIIEQIQEWTSDKQSEGKAAKSENRARAEFPLFLAIQARLS